MTAKYELGQNITHDPEKIEFARQTDLRDHFDWYKEGESALRANPYNELSEEAIRFQIGVLNANLNRLRDQINGFPLLKRSYKPHVPLDPESARRKDLLLHRRALRAGIEKADEQKEGIDKKKLEARLYEVQRTIDLCFPREIMYNNGG